MAFEAAIADAMVSAVGCARRGEAAAGRRRDAAIVASIRGWKIMVDGLYVRVRLRVRVRVKMGFI